MMFMFTIFSISMYILLFGIILFIITPFLLATITILIQKYHSYRRTSHHQQEQYKSSLISSGLYIGRVWHKRYSPKKHSFTYPIFIFGLNLNEIYDDNKHKETLIFNTKLLWPLSYIVYFNPKHHLRNNEGLNNINNHNNTTTTTISLIDRIYCLIAERTNQTFIPNHNTHFIYLLTHLSYYGYCFNPVSFYYIYERNTISTTTISTTTSTTTKYHKLVAVIGEVSNTPWNEMYCYVLHPNSTDNVQMIDYMNNSNNQQHQQQRQNRMMMKIQYIFPKQFHVSPFMEMSYNYEWTFNNFLIVPNEEVKHVQQQQQTSSSDEKYRHNQNRSTIHIINNLRPIPQSSSQSSQRVSYDNKDISRSTTTTSTEATNNNQNNLQFSAILKVQKYSIHPYRIAYYISMYPMYCIIIQLWIHIQAFYLFTKGIQYQPHPNDTKTIISTFIGTMMIPFFQLRDLYNKYYTIQQMNEKSKTKTS